MKILMVLTSHDQLGNTGRPTGFWLEEFAAPYYVFKDAGAAITVASPKGGQPPIDPKRRFSEVAREACCNPEDARALQQRLDDEAKPVIAQSQTPVLQHPRGAALHRPAPLAQSRSGWLASRVDLGRDPEEAAQIAMRLRVVPLVREHGPDAGHNREGRQEQPLEDERVIDVGGRCHTRDRHPVSIYCDVIFGAALGAVGGIGSGQIPAAL